MKLLTPEILSQIAKNAPDHACEAFAPAIVKYAPVADLNTLTRMSCFLSQVMVECDEFKALTERWGPTALQQIYEWPSKQAQRLGNIRPGDGETYRGRGLFWTIGRANYRRMSRILFSDDRLIEYPELLTAPTNAVKAAIFFWKTKEINIWADPVSKNTERLKRFTLKTRELMNLGNYEKHSYHPDHQRRLMHFQRAYRLLQD